MLRHLVITVPLRSVQLYLKYLNIVYCINLNIFFYTDPLQFGFKKDLSCSHALFVLSQTVDYFVQHGINVFMAAFDAKKAFDRVNHVKLFEKLIERGFPAGIVKVLVDWYGKTFACVK